MIAIKNQQLIPVDTRALKKDAQKIVSFVGYKDFDLGILLTTSTHIHALNKQYRHKDKPTDILSFAYHTNAIPSKPIRALSEEEKNLGDIVLCPEYIQKDLSRWNQSFSDRIRFLLVHGICHLMGYDHIKDEDYIIMHQQEIAILAMYNLTANNGDFMYYLLSMLLFLSFFSTVYSMETPLKEKTPKFLGFLNRKKKIKKVVNKNPISKRSQSFSHETSPGETPVLVRHNSATNLKSDAPTQQLTLAIQNNRCTPEMVIDLLSKGANVEKTDANNNTLLMTLITNLNTAFDTQEKTNLIAIILTILKDHSPTNWQHCNNNQETIYDLAQNLNITDENIQGLQHQLMLCSGADNQPTKAQQVNVEQIKFQKDVAYLKSEEEKETNIKKLQNRLSKINNPKNQDEKETRERLQSQIIRLKNLENYMLNDLVTAKKYATPKTLELLKLQFDQSKQSSTDSLIDSSNQKRNDLTKQWEELFKERLSSKESNTGM